MKEGFLRACSNGHIKKTPVHQLGGIVFMESTVFMGHRYWQATVVKFFAQKNLHGRQNSPNRSPFDVTQGMESAKRQNFYGILSLWDLNLVFCIVTENKTVHFSSCWAV